MGKKKKKKPAGAAFTDKLVARLEEGQAGDLGSTAQAAGLSAEAFDSAFAEAVAMMNKGPDPRKLIAMPDPFQIAFMRLAAREEDDELIADLLSMTDSKPVKKEGKRILHGLRSRGLAVDIPDDAGPSVLDRKVETEDKPLPCYLSPPSGNGSRMVLTARYTQGGVAVYQGEISDTEGLVQFAGGTIGRNRYRQMVGGMMDGEEGQLLEIAYDEARWHLAQGADLSRKAGQSVPDEYLQASSELGEVKQEAAPPDPQTKFPAGSASDPDLAARGPELLDLPEFADWLPDESTVEAIDEKIKEVENSQVAINDQQRIDQVQKAIDSAAGLMLADEEKRSRYHGRLLAAAAYLDRTDRPEQARIAAACAWQLLAEGFSAEDSQFFDALVKKLFRSAEEIVAHMAANPSPDRDEEGDGGDQGKLIVPP